MSKLISIAPETHQDLRWRRPSNFLFATSDHLMPLGLQEAGKAIVGLPAAFIKLGDNFMLVATQGLRNGENLVVQESGKWLAAHLPDAYLGFPFRMSRLDKDRYQVCIEEESEFVLKADEVPEKAKGWRPFFDEEGKLADSVAQLAKQMQKHATDLVAAERATEKLAEYELIREWDFAVGDEESPVQVKGLYTIDQQALGKLDGDALVALRDAGALFLAHAQLMSSYHMQALIQIAGQRWKKPGESELEFGESEETGNISFDNL